MLNVKTFTFFAKKWHIHQKVLRFLKDSVSFIKFQIYRKNFNSTSLVQNCKDLQNFMTQNLSTSKKTKIQDHFYIIQDTGGKFVPYASNEFNQSKSKFGGFFNFANLHFKYLIEL